MEKWRQSGVVRKQPLSLLPLRFYMHTPMKHPKEAFLFFSCLLFYQFTGGQEILSEMNIQLEHGAELDEEDKGTASVLQCVYLLPSPP